MKDVNQKWVLCNFKSPAEDFRPMGFPPPGPYWCAGLDSDECWDIVAYVRKPKEVSMYWPEAFDIVTEVVDKIEYSDSRPRPEWWDG